MFFNFFRDPTFERKVGEVSLAELLLGADEIPSSWKFAASGANWAMLAGFLALPSAFDDDSSKFKLPQQVLQALAFTLLVLGYLGTGVICWRQKNQLFQHDTIFMPGFTSSLLGLISTLFNVYGKVYTPPDQQWSGSSISATIVSAVFTIFYGANAVAVGRKIDRIRAHDKCVQKLQENAYEDEDLIPEEEKVRRKMFTLMGRFCSDGGGGVNGGASNHTCVCGASTSSNGSSLLLAVGNGVVDGSGVRWPDSAMIDLEMGRASRERDEREQRRRQQEEWAAADGVTLGPRRPSTEIQMSATLADEDERERRRRQQEEWAAADGVTLGPPRRPSTKVQMTATLAEDAYEREKKRQQAASDGDVVGVAGARRHSTEAQLTPTMASHRVEDERERKRREHEERVENSSGLGLPPGLRRPSTEIQMIATLAEDERRRRQKLERAAADVVVGATPGSPGNNAEVQMTPTMASHMHSIEEERERKRREREERVDESSGLGLPPGLRRPSTQIQMTATLAGGPIGDEWIP